jgi:tetratricopeptide (TPR) repeat protein
LFSTIPDKPSIAYFFFRDNNPQTQSLKNALCDVSHQLSLFDSKYARYLRESIFTEAQIESVASAWKVLFADYWLSQQISRPTYIVLDGLDEALAGERKEFFQLLEDVSESSSTSNLRFAMLGRPQVIDDMILANMTEPPTIHVDTMKNGQDIDLYVRSSIANSKPLKRVKASLKTKIAETLTQKADGMFMWVRLMIEELSKTALRGRESQVEKVLSEAPKGLSNMIEHVLEGFAATLSLTDSEDLNDMFMWVTLAGRPLYLGELDAALRLKSENGEGLGRLEDSLRKAYSGFFSLTRGDGLSTSDLLGRQPLDESSMDRAAESEDDSNADEDSLFEFRSDPRTTIVSFSHASISDFFSNPKCGKIKAQGGDVAGIGFDLVQARATITETCLRIIDDQDFRNRMTAEGGAVSLIDYARNEWCQHLSKISRASIDSKLGRIISTRLTNVLRDDEVIQEWAVYCESSFFTTEQASAISDWLMAVALQDASAVELVDLVESSERHDPLAIFGPVMQCLAKSWLDASPLAPTCDLRKILFVLYSWLKQSKGEALSKRTRLRLSEVSAAAELGTHDETATFYRNLAFGLQSHHLYEAAALYFQKAVALDSGDSVAIVALAEVHLLHLRNYKKAAEISKRFLESMGENACGLYDAVTIGKAHACLAKSTVKIRGWRDPHSDDSLEKDKEACHHFAEAFKNNNKDSSSLRSCVAIWRGWANRGLYSVNESALFTLDDLPAPETCYLEIMSLAQQADRASAGGGDHNTHHWLWDINEGPSVPDKSYYLLEVSYDEFGASFAWFEGSIAIAAEQTNQLPWLQQCYQNALDRARMAHRTDTIAKVTLGLANLCHKFADNKRRAVKLWTSLVLPNGFSQRASVAAACCENAIISLSLHHLNDALGENDPRSVSLSKLVEFWKLSIRYVMRMHMEHSAHTNDGVLRSPDCEDQMSQNAAISILLAQWYYGQGDFNSRSSATQTRPVTCR